MPEKESLPKRRTGASRLDALSAMSFHHDTADTPRDDERQSCEKDS